MVFNLDYEGEIANAEIGGKAANLRSMLALGLPVPPGIVIPHHEYSAFLAYNCLTLDLARKTQPEEIKECLREMKQTILVAELQPGLAAAVAAALGMYDCLTFAVRSSANIEDSSESSFAGVFLSCLNVPASGIEEHIKKVWASVLEWHVYEYINTRGQEFSDIKMGVVIQQMMNPEVSGVCFSVNPVSKDPTEMVVEAVFGLGEPLVSGEITPDTYFLSATAMSVSSVYPSVQTKAMVNQPTGTAMIDLPPEKSAQVKLSDAHLKTVCSLAKMLSLHYQNAIDMEFILQNDQLYIVQVRPITTLN